MLKKYRYLFLAAVVVVVALSGLYLVGREVTLSVDGQIQTVRVSAFTVGGVLREAGIQVGSADILSPPADIWVGKEMIVLERARPVQVWVSPGEERVDLLSASRTARALIGEAGLTLAEGDYLTLNGQLITPDVELLFPVVVIQLHRAVNLTLFEGGADRPIKTSAETVGNVLSDAGVVLHPADRLSPPADTPVVEGMEIVLRRAVPITVRVQGKEVQAYSAAETVGEALADAGIALQGLDQSQPGEVEPVPADGIIQIVRVSEEVVLSQTLIPFENKYVQDPESELDQTRTITPGSPGILLSRERVRYEDGKEISRTAEAQWQARAPVDEEVGYGTQVVIKTLDTPNGPIEYWRAVTVYITSYSPCNLGVPGLCDDNTASGMKVQQGIIAVTRNWYSWMSGQRLYVPGYGTGVVADVGGGVPGSYWIDVAYTDAEYVGWHYYRTIYFLTPVPENIPWILP